MCRLRHRCFRSEVTRRIFLHVPVIFFLFLTSTGQSQEAVTTETIGFKSKVDFFKTHFGAETRQSMGGASSQSSILQDSALVEVGRWAGGPCYAVAVRGNYAYIGNGPLFQVVDITIAESPIVVGEVVTDGVILDLAVKGNYAYTIDPVGVIDISDPSAPQLVYSQRIAIAPWMIRLDTNPDSNYFYLGNAFGGVYVVSIANPALPQILSAFGASGQQITSIAQKNSYLYVTTSNGIVMEIFDIKNKTSPVLANEVGGFTGSQLAINGNNLYADGQVIWEISVPDTPRYVSTINLGQGYVYSVAVKDSLVYVSKNTQGIYVVNVADKLNPYLVDTLPWIGPNFEAFVGPVNIGISNFGLCLASVTGLWSVTLHADTLATSSFMPTGNWAADIVLHSHYALVGGRFAGLQVFDLVDPTRPRLTKTFPTSLPTNGIAVRENVVYLPTGLSYYEQELLLLDVSQPETPSLISKMALSDTISHSVIGSATINDSILFVSFRGWNFRAIDVSNSASLRILSSTPTAGFIYALAISGSHLYVAENGHPVYVFDVLDPSNPRLVDSLSSISALGMNVNCDKLYVATLGLAIYDITSPAHPAKLGEIGTPGSRSEVDISISDRFAYLAYGGNLVTIDVINPLQPRIIAVDEFFYGAFGVASRDDLVIVTNSREGFRVYRNPMVVSIGEGKSSGAIQEYKLHQNYPNPFNPKTTIQYDIPTSGTVELTIFDLNGKEVKRLISEYQRPGSYSFEWDGRNSAGQYISSGIYFCNLKTPGKTLTNKIVLIR